MRRRKIMRDQNDTATKVIDLTTSQIWYSDPLSTSVMTENARLIELAKFIGKAAKGLIKAVQGWNSRNTLSRELSTMPDYMLWDIGIRRDQIPAIVAGKLKRGSLSLSPASDQSAPAIYKEKDEPPLAV
jgi:uncharacterized protein YjiS (DUF1127 family)